ASAVDGNNRPAPGGPPASLQVPEGATEPVVQDRVDSGCVGAAVGSSGRVPSTVTACGPAAAETEACRRPDQGISLKTRFNTIAIRAAALIPELMISSNQWGKIDQKSGEAIGMTPTPIVVATMIRLRLFEKATVDRVRIPLAATDPNSTSPAPPSTGSGIDWTTRPTTGRSPRTTRMAPPVATA